MKKLSFEKCGWFWILLSIILALITYKFDLLQNLKINKIDEVWWIYFIATLIINMAISAFFIKLIFIPIWNLFAKKE